MLPKDRVNRKRKQLKGQTEKVTKRQGKQKKKTVKVNRKG